VTGYAVHALGERVQSSLLGTGLGQRSLSPYYAKLHRKPENALFCGCNDTCPGEPNQKLGDSLRLRALAVKGCTNPDIKFIARFCGNKMTSGALSDGDWSCEDGFPTGFHSDYYGNARDDCYERRAGSRGQTPGWRRRSHQIDAVVVGGPFEASVRSQVESFNPGVASLASRITSFVELENGQVIRKISTNGF